MERRSQSRGILSLLIKESTLIAFPCVKPHPLTSWRAHSPQSSCCPLRRRAIAATRARGKDSTARIIRRLDWIKYLSDTRTRVQDEAEDCMLTKQTDDSTGQTHCDSSSNLHLVVLWQAHEVAALHCEEVIDLRRIGNSMAAS